MEKVAIALPTSGVIIEGTPFADHHGQDASSAGLGAIAAHQ
jgi:hypothetical protein